MLFFIITLVAGVAALLAAQQMDIEVMHPPAPKPFKTARKANSKSTGPVALPQGAAFLRQQ